MLIFICVNSKKKKKKRILTILFWVLSFTSHRMHKNKIAESSKRPEYFVKANEVLSCGILNPNLA